MAMMKKARTKAEKQIGGSDEKLTIESGFDDVGYEGEIIDLGSAKIETGPSIDIELIPNQIDELKSLFPPGTRDGRPIKNGIIIKKHAKDDLRATEGQESMSGTGPENDKVDNLLGKLFDLCAQQMEDGHLPIVPAAEAEQRMLAIQGDFQREMHEMRLKVLAKERMSSDVSKLSF